MRLTLGERTFDLARRALVVGLTEPAMADGADVVEAEPVLVRTDDPDQVAAAQPGATVVLADGVVHATVAEMRACLVELAHRAEAAGFPPDRIVLEPALDRPGLQHVQRVAELGYPVMVSITPEALDRLGAGSDPEDRRALALAATTLAICGGARLIRADDVRGARRVADVMAAVLEAR